MNLDKSKWKKVTLDEVIVNKKITVDARNCGLDRYIAGDHMSTEDLHLRRFGIIGDDYLGPAFHRKFEKGDILYGSRRTYLKKVAIADFDGITSNTTFVLREREDKVIPGFIPFLMLSDKFTKHSVMHSKGSVNPYINYKDIGQYEFILPPKEQQAELAELLWAGDLLKENYTKLEIHQKNAGLKCLVKLFNKLFADKQTHVDTLNNIGKWYSGGTPSKNSKPNWENGTICWISPKDAKAEEITTSEDKISEIALSTSNLRLHPEGSFCIVWRSGILQHSLPIIKVNCPFTINQDMKVFESNSDLIKSEYVRIFLLVFKDKIRDKVVKEGTTVQSISTDSFLKWPIPIPRVSLQEDIIRTFNTIKHSESQIKMSQNKNRVLQKELINQIFSH